MTKWPLWACGTKTAPMKMTKPGFAENRKSYRPKSWAWELKKKGSLATNHMITIRVLTKGAFPLYSLGLGGGVCCFSFPFTFTNSYPEVYKKPLSILVKQNKISYKRSKNQYWCKKVGLAATSTCCSCRWPSSLVSSTQEGASPPVTLVPEDPVLSSVLFHIHRHKTDTQKKIKAWYDGSCL